MILPFMDFRLRKPGVRLFWNAALEFVERYFHRPYAISAARSDARYL